MIEISINQLSKYYGAKQVFGNISLDLMTHDRVGLIGSNGCGKTTLLKVIQGTEDYQAGSIQVRKDARIRYLDQFMDFGDQMTVEEVCISAFQDIHDLRENLRQLEHAMSMATGADLDLAIRRYSRAVDQFESLGGYDVETRMEMVMQGLEISPAMRAQRFVDLSGGEKTRVALARMLLEEPDILLLDEPSNHLDIPAVEWLENFLKSYKGTVLMVSHDRSFLDRTVTRIIELQADRAEAYLGNYSDYVVEREQRFLLALREYENQQKKIERMEDQIERYKIWGAMRDSEKMEKAAKVLEKKLAKIDRLDRPVIDKPQMKLNLDITRRSGKEVLNIVGLSHAFGENRLFSDLNLQLFYKDRACLLGRNGCGKTTLLKLILGELPVDQGSIRLGAGLIIGYLPQEVDFPDEELTLLTYFSHQHLVSTGKAWTELARALFRKDDVNKQIKSLSGGEKRRLKLCSLCYEKVNLLIMDEPTNHLDIESREALEANLKIYEGTLLFVSHDRYFIGKIADQILLLEDGQLQVFRMDYDDYREEIQFRRNRLTLATAAATASAAVSAAAAKASKPVPGTNPRQPMVAKQPSWQRRLEQLEAMIEQTEAEQNNLAAEMAVHAYDAGRLAELYQARIDVDDRLGQLMQKWEQLQAEQS